MLAFLTLFILFGGFPAVMASPSGPSDFELDRNQAHVQRDDPVLAIFYETTRCGGRSYPITRSHYIDVQDDNGCFYLDFNTNPDQPKVHYHSVFLKAPNTDFYRGDGCEKHGDKPKIGTCNWFLDNAEMSGFHATRP